MSTFVYVLASIVLGLLILWYFFKARNDNKGDSVVVLKGSQSGREQTTSGATLPRSFNQPQGITFSYAGWVLVNDFALNYGSARRIFDKSDAPSLYLDNTSNSLLLTLDTYGAKEGISIQGIPAKKWIHFAIVVNQYAVDIYINGILKQHHTLNQLPKQNDASVVIGSTPGFDGTIGNITYWPRTITQAEVSQLTNNVPAEIYRPPEGPKYFDISWYTTFPEYLPSLWAPTGTGASAKTVATSAPASAPVVSTPPPSAPVLKSEPAFYEVSTGILKTQDDVKKFAEADIQKKLDEIKTAPAKTTEEATQQNVTLTNELPKVQQQVAYDVNKNLNASIWGGDLPLVTDPAVKVPVVTAYDANVPVQAPIVNVQQGVTDPTVIAQAQVGDRESKVVQNIDQNVANQAGQDWAKLMQQQQAQNSNLWAQQAAEQAAANAQLMMQYQQQQA
jgi:hypothetical protein